MGSPRPLQLIELGPGRGTLSQDVLRVLSKLGISKDLSIHLVEISPHLSQLQSQRLCYRSEENNSELYYRSGETLSGMPVYWYRRIEDVPTGFSIILAHEFFDALPIHKFQRTENTNKWKEVLIDADLENEKQFRCVISRSETAMLHLFLRTLAEDETRHHIEYSVETDAIIHNIARRLEEDGGFSLIMDYGHFGDKTDTFRVKFMTKYI